MRLIDADALKRRMLDYYQYSQQLCEEISDFFDNTPTIKLERKKGRWIFDKNDYLTKCSECGCHPWFGVIPTVKEATKKLPHCPMCLAKMEENNENSDLDHSDL